MANEIAEFPLLVIFNELIIKCMIGFARFVRVSQDQMQIIEKDHYFHCSAE